MLARYVAVVRGVDAAPAARYALVALVPFVGAGRAATSRAAVAAHYYATTRRPIATRSNSIARCRRGALVVIGHYGADVQYYIDRFGWEEDPLLWTPFDEESAIAKGARYFIAVEDHRLRHNLELCAWLHRFPVTTTPGGWPVYQTFPAKHRRARCSSGELSARPNALG